MIAKGTQGIGRGVFAFLEVGLWQPFFSVWWAAKQAVARPIWAERLDSLRGAFSAVSWRSRPDRWGRRRILRFVWICGALGDVEGAVVGAVRTETECADSLRDARYHARDRAVLWCGACVQ